METLYQFNGNGVFLNPKAETDKALLFSIPSGKWTGGFNDKWIPKSIMTETFRTENDCNEILISIDLPHWLKI